MKKSNPADLLRRLIKEEIDRRKENSVLLDTPEKRKQKNDDEEVQPE
jgi:hypothetical protein